MSCKLSASISAGSCGWLSALSSSKRNMWCEFQGTLAVALSSSHGPPRCGRWWMVSFTMHTSVSSLQRVPLHRRALQTSMGGAQVTPFIHDTPKCKRSHLQCKTFTHILGGKHLSRTSIAKGSVESTHKVQYRRPTDHRRPYHSTDSNSTAPRKSLYLLSSVPLVSETSRPLTRGSRADAMRQPRIMYTLHRRRR